MARSSRTGYDTSSVTSVYTCSHSRSHCPQRLRLASGSHRGQRIMLRKPRPSPSDPLAGRAAEFSAFRNCCLRRPWETGPSSTGRPVSRQLGYAISCVGSSVLLKSIPRRAAMAASGSIVPNGGTKSVATGDSEVSGSFSSVTTLISGSHTAYCDAT